MKLIRFTLPIWALCFGPVLVYAQMQDIERILPPPNTQIQADKNVQLITIADRVDNNLSDPKAKVSESVIIKVGPIGELYLVSGLNDFVKVGSGRTAPFIFPSLIFDMSASPVLREVISGKKDKKKVENTDYDLEWRDVTVTVGAKCREVDKTTGDVKEITCNDSIEVLEVLPNKTGSGHKDSLAVQLAGAFTDLATASAPFFPASTFNEKATAAGGGLSVLFRNLFPPETQTFYHAFVADPRTFGWNFKQDHQSAANTSLLGLNRGIVLFKAAKNVTKITVKYQRLSRWNKDLNDSPFNSFPSETKDYPLPPVKPSQMDYDALGNLDSFPTLIHLGNVLNILHLVNDTLYANWLSNNRLVKAEELDSVTKSSVVSHLKALRRYSPEQVVEITSDLGDSISKPDVIEVLCRHDLPNCPLKTTSPEITQLTEIKWLGEYAQRSSVE